jgi:hypothetical protein
VKKLNEKTRAGELPLCGGALRRQAARRDVSWLGRLRVWTGAVVGVRGARVNWESGGLRSTASVKLI